MVRGLRCGTKLLTRRHSALALTATMYRNVTHLPPQLTKRRDWYYLHRKFAPLILHHRVTARIVNVPSSKRGSIRFESKSAVLFQNRPAVKDRSCRQVAVEFRWRRCCRRRVDSSCFESWDGCFGKLSQQTVRDHARRDRRLQAGLATFVWLDRSNRVRGGRSADYHGQRGHGRKLCAIQPR